MIGDGHLMAGGMATLGQRPAYRGEAQQEVERYKKTGGRYINCDQVAWLLDVFGRYLPPSDKVVVSREREMKKYGMLYEVMEVANLEFQDASARHNGTPPDARAER